MATENKPSSTIKTTSTGDVITIAVPGQPVIIARMGEMDSSIRDAAMVYGMIVRLTRAAALSRDTTTGVSATDAEKYSEIKKLADHYMNGATEWNMARGASGPRGNAMNDLTLAALARVQGNDIPTTKARAERVCEKRGITLTAFCTKLAAENPAVASAMNAIRAEGAKDSGLDVDDLMSDMDEE